MKDEKKSLLEESIVEANELRNIALLNAKKELMEAFQPRIKSMLSKVIEAEADEDLEDEEELEVVTDDEEVADEELDLELEDEEAIDLDIPDEEVIEDEEEIDLELEDEDLDEELDLDIEDDDEEEVVEEIDDEEIDLDIPDEDEELDLDLEDDLADEDEEILNLDITDDDIDDEEIDLELEDEELDEEIDLSLTEEETVDLDIEDDEELEEAYGTIKELKSKIHEVNLLNYKLSYANNIFNKFSLNKRQKVRIIESFDKATNLKEIKTIHASIKNNLTKINDKRKPLRKLKESVSRVKTSTTRSKKPIVNDKIADATTTRMSYLAGITKRK